MLPEPTFNSYLLLGAVLCVIGAGGVFARRNLLTVLLSVEVMIVGVVLTLVAADRYLGRIDGQVVGLWVIALSAGQLALGLVIAWLCVRRQHSLDPDEVTDLRW